MGDLKAFMLPPVMEQTEKVVISKRFKDEKGNVIPFEIRAISQEINESLYEQASKPVKKNGAIIGRNLDNDRYSNLLLVACTIYPNFKDSDLCAYYKTKDPADVPARMLSSGEFKKLTSAVMQHNGFGEDQQETLEEEAKN